MRLLACAASSNDMPPDGLLLLRGGDRIPHEDEVLDLIDAAAAAGRRYTLDGRPFYSLSTFGVAPGTTENDVLAALPLRRFPAVYRVRAGAVYARGLKVWATFPPTPTTSTCNWPHPAESR